MPQEEVTRRENERSQLQVQVERLEGILAHSVQSGVRYEGTDDVETDDPIIDTRNEET